MIYDVKRHGFLSSVQKKISYEEWYVKLIPTLI